MPILDELCRIYRARGHEIVAGIPSWFSNLPLTDFTYIVTADDTSCNALGISPNEIYFFEHLFRVHHPRTLFVVGNCFGWSTFALALLNPGSQVVAIEAGGDPFTTRWIDHTNQIAKEEGLRIRVEKGTSPGDVAAVVAANFSDPIDFVFVDGGHTNEQVQLDFDAVLPFTRESSVFLFHDVVYWNLVDGVKQVTEKSGLDAHLLWRTSTGMVLLCRDALHRELVELLGTFELGPKTLALFRSLRRRSAPAPAS